MQILIEVSFGKMQVIWILVLCCLSATAIESDEDTRVNGENGWYLPMPGGTLKWVSNAAVESFKQLEAFERKLKPVKFILYNRSSGIFGKTISTKAEDIKNSGFNPEWLTAFVTHGFLQNQWSYNINAMMRQAFFERGDCNFIFIQWLGADTPNYIEASREVPFVGAKVAELFDVMVKEHEMDLHRTVLVGHSLGAHVVGIAAKNIRSGKVPYIIGLDPALPLFPYSDPVNRLNSTDGEYVESIQTDGGFYGHLQPVGSATFYCNGGKTQPGCGIVNVCNHERSVAYYAEAVARNSFPSRRCDGYRNAVNGSCGDKLSNVNMGDDKNKFVASGVYYVKTNRRSPYGTLKV